MASAEINEQSTAATKSREAKFAAFFKNPILLSLVLAVATVALYAPVHHDPFINYDDNDYVYANPQVQSGLSWTTVKWAFTTSAASNWHPLTWLTHATVYELFGPEPAAQHDANLLFHTLNVILLFWVLMAATGFVGRSFMVAALFALHPVNVESVAWVAELKTSLSTLFFLLALGAYGWYARRPDRLRMTVVCSLFAAGLMAKPQIITFPFVLLLWDYWPLRRLAISEGESIDASRQRKNLSALATEKIPLFVLALISAMVTMHAQHLARGWFPRLTRVGNAVLSYSLYIKNALWPSKLALLYPHPGVSIQWWKVIASAFFLTGMTVFVVLQRRRRYLPVGWFWFLGTLVPMLGIIQVGVQGMANRYAYVSYIGLFLMICWGVAEFARQKRIPAAVLTTVSVCILASLAVVARQQINLWQDEEVLWQHTIANTTRNWLAESQLGAVLAMHGDISEAVKHFNSALAINSDDGNSNMGVAMYDLQQGNFSEAIRHYRVVVAQANMKVAARQDAYIGMAKAYRALGNREKSIESLAKAKSLSAQ
jgi:protein O-mannosyl-transferase